MTRVEAPIPSQERIPLQDHCGIVAALAPKDTPFLPIGVTGLCMLQTRGYDGAGFVSRNECGQLQEYKNQGRIVQVFTEDILARYRDVASYQWFLQTRYGTNGDFNYENVQPIVGTHFISDERFIVIHNGEFEGSNRESRLSDTVEFVHDLEQTQNEDWHMRIVSILNQKMGAWSLAIGVENAMYLARDSDGYRPLCYGFTKEGVLVAASETIALEKMGIHTYKEVMPGRILKAYRDEVGSVFIQEIKPESPGDKKHCSFENIYFEDGDSPVHKPRKNPDDIMYADKIQQFRYCSGQILAREAPLSSNDVDIVIGVPGTGIPGGQGYAAECNLPYVQAIEDNDGENERTFMNQQVSKIYQKVLNHFHFSENEIRGKRIVLVDDSIVRGNISVALTKLLKELYEAKEVHWRVLSPPIDKPCIRGINTRRTSELIAARNECNVDAICNEIGADSLVFLSHQGLTLAQGGFYGCRDCFIEIK